MDKMLLDKMATTDEIKRADDEIKNADSRYKSERGLRLRMMYFGAGCVAVPLVYAIARHYGFDFPGSENFKEIARGIAKFYSINFGFVGAMFLSLSPFCYINERKARKDLILAVKKRAKLGKVEEEFKPKTKPKQLEDTIEISN